MIYTINRGGQIERLPYGEPFRDAAGVLHPWAAVYWPEGELAAIGVTREDEPVVEPVPVDLAALKADLRRQIDYDAETVRGRYITPGAGQAMTYQAKAAEAVRYLALPSGGDPDPADYPMLMAEIGITGETLHEVAQVIAAMHAQWQAVGSAIERARLAAKAAVDAAADEHAARAVTPAWPNG